MFKQVSRLIIDNSSHQPFREVGMQTEFNALFRGFGIELCVTSPVGITEYKVAGVSIGTKDTDSWKTIDTSTLGYNTKGEQEAIALAMVTNTGTGFMTSDIAAQNRCEKNEIFYQDHIETLFMLVEVNIISRKDASFIYEEWDSGIPKIGTNIPKKYPRDFDSCEWLLINPIRKKMKLFPT